MMIYKAERVEVVESGGLLSRIQYSNGNQAYVPTQKLKPLKPSEVEKYNAAVETIRNAPESYYVAGCIVAFGANLHASTPPSQQERTIEELIEAGMDFDDASLTISTDATQGRSFTVVMPDHGISEELESATGVRSTRFYETNQISIQAKQFVLSFLGGDLGFRLGRTQEPDKISNRVPPAFQKVFRQGLRGEKFVR